MSAFGTQQLTGIFKQETSFAVGLRRLFPAANGTVFEQKVGFRVTVSVMVRVSGRSGKSATTQLQGGPKKRDHRLTAIILSNLNRFTFFFTGRFLRKFAVKWILNIPPEPAPESSKRGGGKKSFKAAHGERRTRDTRPTHC